MAWPQPQAAALSHVFNEGRDANRGIQMCQVWRGAYSGPKLFWTLPHKKRLIRHLFVRSPWKLLGPRPECQWKILDIYNLFFRNVCSPLCNKEITAFLRHPEQCLIPSPQNAFCFTNVSCLLFEKFKFFEKHVKNLNTLQNNLASWDLIQYAKG
jgi:hypothetical protein